MMSFEELTKSFTKKQRKEVAKSTAELNVELDAAAAYHERTGRQWHWLSNTQQRNEIERYINEHGIS